MTDLPGSFSSPTDQLSFALEGVLSNLRHPPQDTPEERIERIATWADIFARSAAHAFPERELNFFVIAASKARKAFNQDSAIRAAFPAEPEAASSKPDRFAPPNPVPNLEAVKHLLSLMQGMCSLPSQAQAVREGVFGRYGIPDTQILWNPQTNKLIGMTDGAFSFRASFPAWAEPVKRLDEHLTIERSSGFWISGADEPQLMAMAREALQPSLGRLAKARITPGGACEPQEAQLLEAFSKALDAPRGAKRSAMDEAQALERIASIAIDSAQLGSGRAKAICERAIARLEDASAGWEGPYAGEGLLRAAVILRQTLIPFLAIVEQEGTDLALAGRLARSALLFPGIEPQAAESASMRRSSIGEPLPPDEELRLAAAHAFLSRPDMSPAERDLLESSGALDFQKIEEAQFPPSEQLSRLCKELLKLPAQLLPPDPKALSGAASALVKACENSDIPEREHLPMLREAALACQDELVASSQFATAILLSQALRERVGGSWAREISLSQARASTPIDALLKSTQELYGANDPSLPDIVSAAFNASRQKALALMENTLLNETMDAAPPLAARARARI